MPAVIGYQNLFDTATVSQSGGGVPMTGYPLANLKVRQLSSVWRALKTPAPKIVIDLGVATNALIVAMLNVNFAPGTAFLNTFLTSEYSSDGTTWFNTGGVLANDAGSPNLSNAIISQIPDQSAGVRRKARYFRLTPNWTTAAGVTFFECGRIWIGDGIMFPDGCDAGWKLSTFDPGAIDESAGGQYYADPRQKARVLSLPCSNIPTTIAYGFDDDDTSANAVPSIDDMIETVGNTGEVIAAHRTSTPLWWRRTGIYGHLSPDSLTITHQGGSYHSIALTLTEER